MTCTPLAYTGQGAFLLAIFAIGTLWAITGDV
jgi:hypothetical protein